jgi:hypothetical protein
MARETRAATGNSKPRVFPKVEETTTTKTTTKKAKPKANTTAKRAPKATTTKASKPTGVTKKKAAPKKKTTVATKVKGEAEKVVGAVTANPAKKVCAPFSHFPPPSHCFLSRPIPYSIPTLYAMSFRPQRCKRKHVVFVCPRRDRPRTRTTINTGK